MPIIIGGMPLVSDDMPIIISFCCLRKKEAPFYQNRRQLKKIGQTTVMVPLTPPSVTPAPTHRSVENEEYQMNKITAHINKILSEEIEDQTNIAPSRLATTTPTVQNVTSMSRAQQMVIQMYKN